MDLPTLVRRTVYERTADSGRVPTFEEVALDCGRDVADVHAAGRMLADAHVFILRPDGRQLWAAPPFAAVPTAFSVRVNRRTFYAPCAWDAFGIPAALKQDAAIETRCAFSGERLSVGVQGDKPYGAGLIHLEVPARHFWDDIIYT